VDELGAINSIKEITYRGEGPQTLRVAARTLPHTACIVPASIVKAMRLPPAWPSPRMRAYVSRRSEGFAAPTQ